MNKIIPNIYHQVLFKTFRKRIVISTSDRTTVGVTGCSQHGVVHEEMKKKLNGNHHFRFTFNKQQTLSEEDQAG